MRWYPHRTPWMLQQLRPSCVWKIQPPSDDEKNVYLTFDDGPIPKLTPWVLDLLKEFDAKATFFCVGENIKKNPKIADRICCEGHNLGNHTYNHLNQKKTQTKVYLENIKKCDSLLQNYPQPSYKLFRPPYGRISGYVLKKLKQDYQIIMWDYLTGDFDKSLDPNKCLHRALKGIQNGSIVTFHDNMKAERNLKHCLPGVLKHFSANGYLFKNISF